VGVAVGGGESVGVGVALAVGVAGGKVGGSGVAVLVDGGVAVELGLLVEGADVAGAKV
jgi:hypothetical protein